MISRLPLMNTLGQFAGGGGNNGRQQSGGTPDVLDPRDFMAGFNTGVRDSF